MVNVFTENHLFFAEIAAHQQVANDLYFIGLSLKLRNSVEYDHP